MKNQRGYNQKSKANATNTRIKELNSIKELIAKNSYGKANAELVRYMERYPNDMFGIFLYGRLQFKYKEYKAAKEAFRRVANSDSNNKYSAMAELGNIAVEENDLDTARMYYKKAITESPNLEVFTILAYSRMERRIKNVDKALEVLSLKSSNEPRIILERVKCLYLKDDLNEARRLLDTLRTDTNDDFFNRSVHLEYARLEKIEGTFETAIPYVEKAKQSPKDFVYIQALYEEIKLYIKYGDYNKALEVCQELMTTNHPYDDEVFLMRGIIYQGLRQIEKATADYQIAATSTDLNTKGTASFHLGNILFARGDFEQAEKLLVDSLEVYGEYFVSGYFKLVSLYIKQERYDEAAILINELVEQFPEITEDISYVLAKRVLDNKRGTKSTDEPFSYVEKQIINYDKEYAIKHIQLRHKDGYDGKTIFTTDKSTEDLYSYVLSQMTEDNMIYEDIMDTYSIDYPSIGISPDGEILNHIRVVAIPNTKDIITMYPCEDYFLPRKKDYKQEEKPKQMSRVDKFNKRFAASQK